MYAIRSYYAPLRREAPVVVRPVHIVTAPVRKPALRPLRRDERDVKIAGKRVVGNSDPDVDVLDRQCGGDLNARCNAGTIRIRDRRTRGGAQSQRRRFGGERRKALRRRHGRRRIDP